MVGDATLLLRGVRGVEVEGEGAVVSESVGISGAAVVVVAGCCGGFGCFFSLGPKSAANCASASGVHFGLSVDLLLLFEYERTKVDLVLLARIEEGRR